ncbi:MAG TPA: DUF6503 family protein [Cyclobacteriaceae bacterium]|nr:DUF6503 family protein [Cyclobacteriaceae bacterium]HRK53867.1 DUF6503 family protein [Cyclobacteriaceae bacterium]
MNYKKLTLLLVIVSSGVYAVAQEMSAAAILEKSIQYHDPKGQWSSFNHEMQFVSERPNGPDRKSIALIDNSKGYFHLEENGNQMTITMDDCTDIPEGKTCDDVKRTRNYYVYLWGLPMKLKDKGTVLDEKVMEEEFEGKDCYVLRVPYAADIWYFYINRATYKMEGYMFYKDEPTKKGEVIYLEGEVRVGDTRIPKTRKWVTTPDGRFLGTDILMSSK